MLKPATPEMQPDRLDHRLSHNARGNAFDSIRLIAATAVLFSHSYMISTGSEALEPLYWASGGQARIGFSAVAVFFVISGLLISQSFDRSSTILSFVRKRALRILPALWVCAILAVFVLGPLATTASLSSYFFGSDIALYLRNTLLLLDDHPLTGVFEDRPMAAVINGSLWTLKYEIACYALCATLMMVGRHRKVAVIVTWLASFAVIRIFGEPENYRWLWYHLMQMANLFRFFGAGMLLYLYRDQVILNPRSAIIALAVVLATIVVPGGFFYEALATLGAYAIIVLAFRAPSWLADITKSGDLSYGVYIYAFPIQQAAVPFSQQFALPWLVNTLIALPLTFLAAWLSWRLVEKPALSLKARRS